MNWEEIKEKYPKAFNLFAESEHCGAYWDISEQKLTTDETLTYERNLYDFFDEQEIYINTSYRNYFELLWKVGEK